MVDREDIDALLIGRLYGELSSADEARLQSHLDAHPTDRSALAELTQTRTMLRQNRLLDAHVEPPQQLSAILMQEAARRAPRSPRAPAGEGWFARFMRSFAMHPGLAAAATLVLVVGVAGTLWVKKGNHFAEQTLESPMASSAVVAVAPAEVQPAAPTAAAGSAAAPLDQQPARQDEKSSMVVGLADSSERQDLVRGRGMEITRPSPEPKDLDESVRRQGTATGALASQPSVPKLAPRVERKPGKAAAVAGMAMDDGEVFGGGVGTATPTRDEPAKDKGASVSSGGAAMAPSSAPVTTKTSRTPTMAPPMAPPPPSATKKEDTSAPGAATRATASVDDRELQKAVAAAKANDCSAADTLATRIANRNFDYYAANVEDNRDLAHCKAVMRSAPKAAEMQRSKRSAAKAASGAK